MPGLEIGRKDRLFDFAVSCLVKKSLLPIIRRFVISVAEDMGFHDEDIIKIEMAVDEACANVAEHAYDGASDDASEPPRQELGLQLSLDPDGLTICIRDCGCGGKDKGIGGAASIEEYQQLDRSSYHGLGILIMKQFMDHVEIESAPSEGVTVTMRKLLSRPSPS